MLSKHNSQYDVQLMDWCSETVEAAQWLSEPEDFVLNKIRCEQGSNPTREDPIGFQVQRLNHSAITARVALYWLRQWEAWSWDYTLLFLVPHWLCLTARNTRRLNSLEYSICMIINTLLIFEPDISRLIARSRAEF